MESTKSIFKANASTNGMILAVSAVGFVTVSILTGILFLFACAAWWLLNTHVVKKYVAKKSSQNMPPSGILITTVRDGTTESEYIAIDLERIDSLRETGAITEAEYRSEKSRLLSL